MKLSEMETDRALDAVEEITECANLILEDDDFKGKITKTVELKRQGLNTRGKLAVFGMTILSGIIPYLLKNHRERIYKILAIINGKKIDEIKKQNLLVTAKMLKEATDDPDLIDVFFSQLPMEDATSSTSVANNAEDKK